MLEALKEAKKSGNRGDVPVGCVIVMDGKIIAKSHNKKEHDKVATGHAEIDAINKACKKLKTWRLENCEMFVTMEPCLMCTGAIAQARIKKVIYATENLKYGFLNIRTESIVTEKNNHKIETEIGMCKEQSSLLLKEFFKDKRN